MAASRPPSLSVRLTLLLELPLEHRCSHRRTVAAPDYGNIAGEGRDEGIIGTGTSGPPGQSSRKITVGGFLEIHPPG